jgi:hypothetical protein
MRLAEKSVRIGWTFADAFKNVRQRLVHKKRDYLFATKDQASAVEYMKTGNGSGVTNGVSVEFGLPTFPYSNHWEGPSSGLRPPSPIRWEVLAHGQYSLTPGYFRSAFQALAPSEVQPPR